MRKKVDQISSCYWIQLPFQKEPDRRQLKQDIQVTNCVLYWRFNEQVYSMETMKNDKTLSFVSKNYSDEDSYESDSESAMKHDHHGHHGHHKKKKKKKKHHKKKKKYKVKKKYKKFLMPLLIAYKLKFLTLVPVFIGKIFLIKKLKILRFLVGSILSFIDYSLKYLLHFKRKRRRRIIIKKRRRRRRPYPQGKLVIRRRYRNDDSELKQESKSSNDKKAVKNIFENEIVKKPW
jgi:hypothetical protein